MKKKVELPQVLQLLPQGEFIVTRKDGQKIKGRFSMYVLDRFCEAKGIDNYLTILEKILSGMKPRDYATLILFAFQDYYRSDVNLCDFKTEIEVLDFIDTDLNGLSGDDIDSLVRHAVGRMMNVKKVEAAMDKILDAEKKSESKSNLKETVSGNAATDQA